MVGATARVCLWTIAIYLCISIASAAVEDLDFDDSVWVDESDDPPVEDILWVEEPVHPPVDYTVAFIGDTGVENSSKKLLSKMKEEWKVNAIFHGGDLAYHRDQNAWWTHFDSVFPDKSRTAFIGTSGNHDLSSGAAERGYGFNEAYWHRYATDIRAREKASGAVCKGTPGQMEVCFINGIAVVNLGYGLAFDKIDKTATPEKYAHFVRSAFSAYPAATWRICHFHKPVTPYALDPRMRNHLDEMIDYTVMHACLDSGAVVANAHHHSYSRTHLMSSYKNEVIFSSSTPAVHTLAPGYSMQWVSGLGGHHPAPIDFGLSQKPFFAARVAHHSRTEDAPYDVTLSDFGALICTFSPTPENNRDRRSGSWRQRVDCKFRDIRDQVHDEFSLKSVPLVDLGLSETMVVEGKKYIDTEEKRWREKTVWMSASEIRKEIAI